MANAYLEWDGSCYWQKALNAVGMEHQVFMWLPRHVLVAVMLWSSSCCGHRHVVVVMLWSSSCCGRHVMVVMLWSSCYGRHVVVVVMLWSSCCGRRHVVCAAGLANSEHSHPAGHLLKTNILLLHENEGDSQRLQVWTLFDWSTH